MTFMKYVHCHHWGTLWWWYVRFTKKFHWQANKRSLQGWATVHLDLENSLYPYSSPRQYRVRPRCRFSFLTETTCNFFFHAFQIHLTQIKILHSNFFILTSFLNPFHATSLRPAHQQGDNNTTPNFYTSSTKKKKSKSSTISG